MVSLQSPHLLAHLHTTFCVGVCNCNPKSMRIFLLLRCAIFLSMVGILRFLFQKALNFSFMLKRICVSIVLLLCAVVCRGQDSAVLGALSEKLAEYFEAMKYEPVEVQKGECDFLIESSSDSLIKTHVAQTIYKHYIDSPIMGSEAVAIHVYDKWFQPGLIKMENDMEMLGAKIFAEFNRQSQIGCKAPELQMSTPDGSPISLFAKDDRHTNFRVLYFYDTDCSKCRMQSILLSNILSTENFPIEFYAIYTGDNQKEWFKYISERFDSSSPNSRIINLWDPEIDSDFQSSIHGIRGMSTCHIQN